MSTNLVKSKAAVIILFETNLADERPGLLLSQKAELKTSELMNEMPFTGT